MKKKYQQPLIDILIINPKDLLKTVNASGEDDAAGAKQFDLMIASRMTTSMRGLKMILNKNNKCW